MGTYLRTEPLSASLEDTLEGPRTTVRRDVSFQPPARAGLTSIDATPQPETPEGTVLSSHVVRLQVIQQLAAVLEPRIALLPVTVPTHVPAALPQALPSQLCTATHRKPNGLRLTENGTLGALLQLLLLMVHEYS